MKQINRNRRIGEIANHLAIVTRNTKKKFHPENIDVLGRLVAKSLQLAFLYNRGFSNAQAIGINNTTFYLDNLPKHFDNYKILFVSDLHIDGFVNLHELIWQQAEELDYDCCILGGDYRFKSSGNTEQAIMYLKLLISKLIIKSKIYGILGNHDTYEIAEELDRLGVTMLLNDSVNLEKNGDFIEIVGVDDGHYFNALDFEEAEKKCTSGALKLLISHSPEIYKEVEQREYSLMLSGHTHGGQICLPGKIPVIREAPVPLNILVGKWHYKTLQGFTSKGVGSSMVPVRFFCKPEMVLITLKRN